MKKLQLNKSSVVFDQEAHTYHLVGMGEEGYYTEILNQFKKQRI